MKHPIFTYGQAVLRKQSVPVEPIDETTKQLIADMFETMYNAGGVGLAAPQIGKAIRLFVIDTEPFTEQYPETEIKKMAFINPKMLEEFGDDFVYSEGCLSLPGINEDVTRKSQIRIQYQDESGTLKEELFSGMVARVIQHEYDHLEGRVFTDHLSSLKKMILKRKLSDIASGKVKTTYKVK